MPENAADRAMTDSRDAARQAVIQKIRDAFASTVRLDKGNILPGDPYDHWEASETYEKLEDVSWQDIPSNVLAYRGLGLVYLTPEALAYYLPGIIIACLTDPEAADSLFDAVLSRLTPPRENHSDFSHWNDLFQRFAASLTQQQRQAVCDFVEFDCDECPDLVFDDDLRALEFWKIFSKQA